MVDVFEFKVLNERHKFAYISKMHEAMWLKSCGEWKRCDTILSNQVKMCYRIGYGSHRV